jgi:hypothetical protein
MRFGLRESISRLLRGMLAMAVSATETVPFSLLNVVTRSLACQKLWQ